MSVQLRRQLFCAVRDLPYQINSAELDTSCVAKTKLLGELLSRIGLQCQVWRAEVGWDTVGLPPKLLDLAPRPVFSHFFLKVYVPESATWVTVDATWDPRFAKSLPANEWDGLSDTMLAYPSTKQECVGSVGEFEFRNFNPNDLFTRQLNGWYESLTNKEI